MADARDDATALPRRAVVMGLGLGIAACVGAVSEPAPAAPGLTNDVGHDGGADLDAGVLDWEPGPFSLVAGAAAAIALAETLPPGVARGGRFGVDPSGDPLPAGVTLTADGLLSGAAASVSAMADVVFTYVEP